MPAIERTAYPRLRQRYFRQQDLQLYRPSQEEINWMKQHVSNDLCLQLSFLVQLKTFQRLGYFVTVNTVSPTIVEEIQKSLNIDECIKPHYRHKATLKRHRMLIRNYMDVIPFDQAIEKRVDKIAFDAAQTMNDPADIINLIIEELIHLRYELPKFNKLDRKVCHIRHQVNKSIFSTIKSRLAKAKKIKILRHTLIKDSDAHVTPYQRLKTLPKSPTITHFKELIQHHNWLMSFGSFSHYLQGISKIKLTQFAQEARALDAPHVKNMKDLDKKYSLMACLLAEAQQQAKDALVLTLTRCIQNSDKAAQRHYESLDKDKDNIAYNLAEFLLTLTQGYKDKRTNQRDLLKLMDKHYHRYGGPDRISEDCEKIIAKHHKKHLPLVWQHYKNKRFAVFKCLDALNLGGNIHSRPLLKAIEQAKHNYTRKTEWIDMNEPIDLSFASKDWRALIATKNGKNLHRHHFEVSVVDELTEKLKSGDIYVEGANAYGNYRRELLPWNACLPLLNAFCDSVNISNNKKQCVHELKTELTKLSKQVDNQYPNLKDLIIDHNGVPTLKRRKKATPKANRLLDAIKSRMPDRKLLDVLCLTHECSGWASFFSPLSGSSSKLSDPLAANIVTAFSYGTRMGPAETARHVRSGINARTIALVNKSHVNLKKLETALASVINYYQGFPLIKAWGTGEACAVDGTLRNIYEQNLLAETHIRYGAKGGIAYHHIADNYVALFATFISCGVWEAIAIIEGLLRNQSDIKPTKVHGDTQAQSATVFGLAYLFGIRLMPRIRQWKELTFFRPTRNTKYKYIDTLFKDTIRWELIENNWQDMMQIVLSVHQSKISSTLVLKRLGSRSRRNQLYLGFRELGRVIRTLFLLEYISNAELRASITAETNKVEAFHHLSDWISFAHRIIVASNDTIEMEKAVRYNTLVTNLIILQNVIDMSKIIQQLRYEGWQIKKEDLSKLSPYLNEHIKRFGDYVLDLSVVNKDIDQIRVAPVVNE